MLTACPARSGRVGPVWGEHGNDCSHHLARGGRRDRCRRRRRARSRPPRLPADGALPDAAARSAAGPRPRRRTVRRQYGPPRAGRPVPRPPYGRRQYGPPRPGRPRYPPPGRPRRRGCRATRVIPGMLRPRPKSNTGPLVATIVVAVLVVSAGMIGFLALNDRGNHVADTGYDEPGDATSSETSTTTDTTTTDRPTPRHDDHRRAGHRPPRTPRPRPRRPARSRCTSWATTPCSPATSARRR